MNLGAGLITKKLTANFYVIYKPDPGVKQAPSSHDPEGARNSGSSGLLGG
jgi:hypothetical protein